MLASANSFMNVQQQCLIKSNTVTLFNRGNFAFIFDCVFFPILCMQGLPGPVGKMGPKGIRVRK